MIKTKSSQTIKLALVLSMSFCLLITVSVIQQAQASSEEKIKVKRIPLQYIAALGDPQASSGGGAQTWGIWRVDPGPRGVWVRDFDKLEAANGLAPAKWQFDKEEWWLDENGLLMEKPLFPVAPGKYLVTGDREAISVLTIHPEDAEGDRRWELNFDAKLYDVTHLPCRSAKYTSLNGKNNCTPANAQLSDFPVTPGAIMPDVAGCQRQDYSVLFVIGIVVDS